MTEQEWLSSDDPAAMLATVTRNTSVPGRDRAVPIVSDHKLRLWCCACCWGVSADLGRDAEQCMGWESGPAKNAAGWARCWSGDQKEPTAARRAALLRDVVGNPYKPAYVVHRSGGELAFDAETSRRTGKRCVSIGMVGKCILVLRDWLTPDVLSLARAAYEERPGREEVYHLAGVPCKRRIDDGTLDPLALLALADALEEAGCPAEWCELCNGTGESFAIVNGSQIQWGCGQCNGGELARRGTGRRKNSPHPLLAHLRSPGPHVRGCFALDLILGKE